MIFLNDLNFVFQVDPMKMKIYIKLTNDCCINTELPLLNIKKDTFPQSLKLENEMSQQLKTDGSIRITIEDLRKFNPDLFICH